MPGNRGGLGGRAVAGRLAAVCLARSTWPALALELAWAAIALRDLLRTRMAPPPAAAR